MFILDVILLLKNSLAHFLSLSQGEAKEAIVIRRLEKSSFPVLFLILLCPLVGETRSVWDIENN